MPAIHTPPEILDLIFENLHPKSSRRRKPDLASCTMVCRAWSGTAQRHMFRRVIYSFSKPNATENLRWEIGGETTHSTKGRWVKFAHVRVPAKSLAMFRRFLETTPTVRPHVQHLLLDCYPSYHYHGFSRPFPRAEEVEPAELMGVLHLLPGLNNLYMLNLTVSRSFSRAVEELSQHPRICHLTLDGYFPEMAPMCAEDIRVAHVLSWFAEVDHLRLDHVGVCEHSHVLSPLNIVVRRLTLSNISDDSAIFQYLAQPRLISSLRCLIIRCGDVSENSGLQDFVNVVGPYLEALYIILPCQKDLTEDLVISCSLCRNLQELRLGVSHVTWQYPWRNILATLANGTLTSTGIFPHFKGLVVDVHLDVTQPPFREELKEDTEDVDLALVALSERLPTFQGVTFEILSYGKPSTLTVPELMASLFPRAAERKLLRYREYSYVWGDFTNAL